MTSKQAEPSAKPEAQPAAPKFESLQENSLDYGNQSMFDDTPLLARIASGYDTLSQNALLTLGADASMRKYKLQGTDNPNREALFGSAISGAMIRQLNRVADTDITPLANNAKLKLLQLRNDLATFLDTFIEKIHSKSMFVPVPNDNTVYDDNRSQIPEERQSKLREIPQETTTLSAGLAPENILTDSIRFVHKGSGETVTTKFKQAGLTKLTKPYMSLYMAMIDFINRGNFAALTDIKIAIRSLLSVLSRYETQLGPFVFNNIVLSCAVAESSVDGVISMISQKQRATYELQTFQNTLKNSVKPSEKSVRPY